ncbi:MAG TPA: 50S ribosomal protein L29 [Acidimicrobiia bacterium]|uniref:Large ribosomal subunit protein uL29 n=1 Tax=uncultured actinobacterium Rifle_16ft_4_minimus_3564 TaxID=1665147 RepID=A0A0H4TNF9_9ACTN|nr:50S ribosomal protein L29, large subunit ribosomal protein L29 [uncultured actinobacterium Rifle_16ft_4_minimus_3564]HKZ30517.1 50S ribosomal protein L29 [Acidimicrobiia bacterium]
MKAIDLRDLTVQELEERLEESKEELFNLRFQLATNQLDNTARLGEVRKDIARLATVIREQELEAWAAQQRATEKEGK